jgi:hypothetical protein
MSALVPAGLPDYVERGGRQVWRPPYTARDAVIFGFVLAADRDAIDGLLQEALVEPAMGAVDYRCAHENIVVTFADIARLASGEPPDSQRGFLREREVSVWCLAADVMEGGRLVWYLPYVFTDSGQTVATGREVYGYPKQIGRFPPNYPDKLAQGGLTTVQALVIPEFRPDAEATRRPVVSVRRSDVQAGARETVSVGASSTGEVMLGFPGEVAVNLDLPFGPQPKLSAAITAVGVAPPRQPASPPWVRRMLNFVQGRGLMVASDQLVMAMVNNPTLVFLKQFRDASCATKACYQAIVEAPIVPHLTRANYRALDPELFKVTIENWASHPIADDLGVEAGRPVTPERAFRAVLDFDIGFGEEVWRAPS